MTSLPISESPRVWNISTGFAWTSHATPGTHVNFCSPLKPRWLGGWEYLVMPTHALPLYLNLNLVLVLSSEAVNVHAIHGQKRRDWEKGRGAKVVFVYFMSLTPRQIRRRKHWLRWKICHRYQWHQRYLWTMHRLPPVSLIPVVHLDLRKIQNDPNVIFRGLGGRWFMKET